ncbi:MAG: hypothetical protein ABSE63_14090 [Thermoguttaceae bacterium]
MKKVRGIFEGRSHGWNAMKMQYFSLYMKTNFSLAQAFTPVDWMQLHLSLYRLAALGAHSFNQSVYKIP